MTQLNKIFRCCDNCKHEYPLTLIYLFTHKRLKKNLWLCPHCHMNETVNTKTFEVLLEKSGIKD